MELLIKQRVFSWTDTYDVCDETGEARYFVKGEFFSLGHKIHIYDKDTGEERGCVAQRLFTLLPTFDIYTGGQMVGTVKKKFTLFTQDYQVDYRGWDVEGDFLGWDYRVVQSGMEVMSISKELFHWGDTYALRYDNPANELPGLLLVIAIDAANCSNDD